VAESLRAPILVVDDNAETREALVHVLAICGYETATAETGSTGSPTFGAADEPR
jgi:CheY-like chemotaxis protein